MLSIPNYIKQNRDITLCGTLKLNDPRNNVAHERNMLVIIRATVKLIIIQLNVMLNKRAKRKRLAIGNKYPAINSGTRENGVGGAFCVIQVCVVNAAY